MYKNFKLSEGYDEHVKKWYQTNNFSFPNTIYRWNDWETWCSKISSISILKVVLGFIRLTFKIRTYQDTFISIKWTFLSLTQSIRQNLSMISQYKSKISPCWTYRTLTFQLKLWKSLKALDLLSYRTMASLILLLTKRFNQLRMFFSYQSNRRKSRNLISNEVEDTQV